MALLIGECVMKNRLKRRKNIIFIIVGVLTVLAIWYAYVLYKTKATNWAGFIEELLAMALSSLISTAIAIWLTRNDILEDDFTQKKDQFGLVTIENGYKNFFSNNDCFAYLHINSWEEFFEKDNDSREIDIVGIALNGFFDDERASLVSTLLLLCLRKNYKVSIIIGNPYSDEIKKQSIGQKKSNENHISSSALTTYEKFKKQIEEINQRYAKGLLSCKKSPSEILNDNFSFLFSDSLPKALIIRAGAYMMVTPYQLQEEGPSGAPTLIVKEADRIGYFSRYKTYVQRLKELSCDYKSLRRNKKIKMAYFFDQPYATNCSQEFFDDLLKCHSLSILGLGQNKMFTNLEGQFIQLIQRGGTIQAVMSKPDGASTEMCVARSLIHENVAEARIEHKQAINKLLGIRDKFGTSKSSVEVLTWDCFFPYTMYAFDIDVPEKSKIYIWITNLFAYSSERDGFVISGMHDKAYAEKYIRQYLHVVEQARKEGGIIDTPYTIV